MCNTGLCFMNTVVFYWNIQKAVFFVDYVENHDSFVGAKKMTDFYSVIVFLFSFTLILFCLSFLAGQLTTLHYKALQYCSFMYSWVSVTLLFPDDILKTLDHSSDKIF